MRGEEKKRGEGKKAGEEQRYISKWIDRAGERRERERGRREVERGGEAPEAEADYSIIHHGYTSAAHLEERNTFSAG